MYENSYMKLISDKNTNIKSMKTIACLILSSLLTSCLLIKPSPLEIRNSKYVCDMGGMVGITTIHFKDSTFIYTERNGLFQGKGRWLLTRDEKTLILDGTSKIPDSDFTSEKRIYFQLNRKRNGKLVGNGYVFEKVSPVDRSK